MLTDLGSNSSYPELLAQGGHKNQERKISPKRKFSGRTSRGHPGVIRADIPGQNFGQGPRNTGKTNISARTSVTRRRGRPRPQGVSKNFGQKNFGLNFRSLKNEKKKKKLRTQKSHKKITSKNSGSKEKCSDNHPFRPPFAAP